MLKRFRNNLARRIAVTDASDPHEFDASDALDDFDDFEDAEDRAALAELGPERLVYLRIRAASQMGTHLTPRIYAEMWAQPDAEHRRWAALKRMAEGTEMADYLQMCEERADEFDAEAVASGRVTFTDM